MELELTQAKKMVQEAVTRIQGEVRSLLSSPLPLDISRNFVIEELLAEIIIRNPEMLAWLDDIGKKSPVHRGEASKRLADALKDWRDDPPNR